MKTIKEGIKMLLVMTVLTGIIYPLFLLFISHLAMPWRAQGSLILKDGKVVGSQLIGQKFTNNDYFWGRPSAGNYDTLPSKASNFGPTSAKLKQIIQEHRFKIAQMHHIQDLSQVPNELVCSSASGIDPHIHLETAYFQLNRVAQARSMTDQESRLKIKELIQKSLNKPLGRLFSHPYVNVLTLNLALDELIRQNEEMR